MKRTISRILAPLSSLRGKSNVINIRVRTVSVIILATFTIVVISGCAGFLFVRNGIEKYQEREMMVVADIADHFLSSEIELIRLKTANTAKVLGESAQTEWLGILDEKMALYPEFIGMTVIAAGSGIVCSVGDEPAPSEIIEDKYIRLALEGKTAISSTVPASGGGMVFYTAAPLPGDNGKILVLTLPGMFFSERVSTFVIWETGHIFIDDNEGNVIANIRENWVQNRQNFLKAAETDPEQYSDIAKVIERLISGETGVSYFTLADSPRLCAFSPITASEEGWGLGIVAPLPESPFNDIDNVLLLVGAVSFFLSIAAAVIASGFIKKPFEEVARLKEIAETNSKSKSNFLAGMSHEMRTPLNAIIGLSDLAVETEGLNSEVKSNLEKIYSSGETLLNIVNDILDISKIEAGKLELLMSEYDIPSLINDTITQNILRTGEKPITFVLNISADLPAMLYGDELRIKQIFNNILSNAFKYTKEGTVEFGIRSEPAAAESGMVWITAWVKDTGVGIRPEDMAKLFNDYSQVDLKANRTVEGTGLGLAITKKMTELMGGTVTVESEYGKGSVFTVLIKQKVISGRTIGEDVAKNLMDFKYTDNKRKRGARLSYVKIPYAKVLVVDDNITNLDVAKGLLKPYGMRVDCVVSGQDAIDAVRREKVIYDAIFMDHMMPRMDGLEALRHIRKIDTDYARSVPIIALTANAITGNEEMFLQSGFQAFLAKPIDLPRLDEVIHNLVRDKDKEKELADEDGMSDDAGIPRDGETVKNTGGHIDGLDMQKGVERFGDEETYLQILKSYAVNTPPLIDSIRAVNEDGLPGYAVTVHGIKGTSYGISADVAGNLAEKLEIASKAGNFDFVKANNNELIKTVTVLIRGIEDYLASAVGGQSQKPKKEKPDKELLIKLAAACEVYDMDGADGIIAAIDGYEYESADGLADWLRANISEGNFDEVKERLLSIGI